MQNKDGFVQLAGAWRARATHQTPEHVVTTPAQSTAPPADGQGAPPEAEPSTEPDPTPDPTPADPGTDPASQATDPEGVQPSPDAQAQPDGGQGLIASYLEDVEDDVRPVVEEKLDQYRKDTDARMTRTFEELNAYKSLVPEGQSVEYLQTPVALYENLMEKPLETVEWIIEQFKGAGVDLRSQLTGQPDGQQPQEPTEPQTPTDPTDDEDRPLTKKEWERLRQEEKDQERQQTQQAEARKKAEGWLGEAAEEFGLSLEGEQATALRHSIITHARQLLPQFQHLGADAGKEAIRTATEALVNTFQTRPAQTPGEQPAEPRLANGGTPPAPEEPDLSDPKARKAWMLSQVKGAANQTE